MPSPCFERSAWPAGGSCSDGSPPPHVPGAACFAPARAPCVSRTWHPLLCGARPRLQRSSGFAARALAALMCKSSATGTLLRWNQSVRRASHCFRGNFIHPFLVVLMVSLSAPYAKANLRLRRDNSRCLARGHGASLCSLCEGGSHAHLGKTLIRSSGVSLPDPVCSCITGARGSNEEYRACSFVFSRQWS